MKKLRVASAVLCLTLSASLLFGCKASGSGTFKFESFDEASLAGTVSQISIDSDASIASSVVVEGKTYLILKKDFDGVKKYAVYADDAQIVSFDAGYISYQTTYMQNYRLIVGKTVDDATKYGVLNIVDGSLVMDCTYDSVTDIKAKWSVSSISDEYFMEEFKNYEDEVLVSIDYKVFEKETGKMTKTTSVSYKDGEYNKFEEKFLIGTESGVETINPDLYFYKLSYYDSEYNVWNEKDKNVGSFNINLAPYEMSEVSGIIGNNLVVQYKLEKDDYADDYDYRDSNGKYDIETYVINYKKGEMKKVKCNYVISEFDYVKGANEYYLTFTGNKIVDNCLGNSRCYIATSSLGSITETPILLTSDTQVNSLSNGNILINDGNDCIVCKKNFDYVGTFESTDFVGAYQDKIVIQDGDDMLFVDANGVVLKTIKDTEAVSFSGGSVFARETTTTSGSIDDNKDIYHYGFEEGGSVVGGCVTIEVKDILSTSNGILVYTRQYTEEGSDEEYIDLEVSNGFEKPYTRTFALESGVDYSFEVVFGGDYGYVIIEKTVDSETTYEYLMVK